MKKKDNLRARKKCATPLKRLLSLAPEANAIVIVALVFSTGASAFYIQNSHKPAPKAVTSTPKDTNVIPVASAPQQSAQQSSTKSTTPAPQKTTQSPSTPAAKSDQPYSPYDTSGSPKDIYGCVVPPTNVSDAKVLGIYQQLYADCINLYKPSWCLNQANNAASSFSEATIQAETTYDNVKYKDEDVIQKGQNYIQQGGQGNILLGQQMVSDGNSALANDQNTYRTAYDAAYNAYSNAILLSNQQGSCGNSIPAYVGPAY